MKHKFAAFALALALSVLGLAGAATAGHYEGTDNVETATRDYEAPSSFGAVAVSTHNEDPVGITGDASIDTGGVIFPACTPDDATSGSFSYGLRCSYTDNVDNDPSPDPLPQGPYDKASITVNDQISTNVAVSPATCSSDGDNWCGENNNTLGGNGGPGTDGPNELDPLEFCTPDSGTLERSDIDPRDGTGDGVWNQTDELFAWVYNPDPAEPPADPDDYQAFADEHADWDMHPGVDALTVFLWDPVAEAVFFTHDPCSGVAQSATTGTITVVGT